MTVIRPDAPALDLPELDFEEPSEQLEIVVVDDNLETLGGLTRHLEKSGYRVRAFPDPLEALRAMRELPPALLLTDVQMPGMSGLELVDEVAGIDPDVRVVIMTGRGDESTAQTALRAGVDDYLTKPVETGALERTLQRSVMRRRQSRYARAVRTWLEAEVLRQTATIQQVSLGAIRALVTALEARSTHFKGHSEAVAACATAVAQKLGLDDRQVHAVGAAGLLHDVGMIGVPDSIVNKPDNLNADEYRQIQEHCQTGARILEPMSYLGSAARFVLEHHERIDGSGYPHRKEGREVSLGGQIVGLAETWTALSESRPYRQSLSPREAMRMLKETAGSWYRADLVHALASIHTLGDEGKLG